VVFTLTIRGAGNPVVVKDAAKEFLGRLQESGVPRLSATLRHDEGANPLVERIEAPEEFDEAAYRAALLPGQVLNSVFDGPGPVSGESYAAVNTDAPELTKEQKAAMAENEKQYEAAKEAEKREAEEKLAEREQQAADVAEENAESLRLAEARGVVPMGEVKEPEPDLRVAVVDKPEPAKKAAASKSKK
jgi:hypothetical protein